MAAPLKNGLHLKFQMCNVSYSKSGHQRVFVPISCLHHPLTYRNNELSLEMAVSLENGVEDESGSHLKFQVFIINFPKSGSKRVFVPNFMFENHETMK